MVNRYLRPTLTNRISNLRNCPLLSVVYERKGSRSENRNIQVENKYVGLNNER